VAYPPSGVLLSEPFLAKRCPEKLNSSLRDKELSILFDTMIAIE
jgi:hypothetical protein